MGTIGERLRAVLPSSRGEQKALAFRAGVTPQSLSKILTGKTKEPGFDTIARLARAAGISLDELYDGQVARQPEATETQRAIRRLTEALAEFSIEQLDALNDVTALIQSTVQAAATERGGDEVPTTSSGDPKDATVQRLTATVLRLDEAQQRRFFEELASRDTYEILSIRSRSPSNTNDT